jgi:hypothetical protein
MAAMMRTILFFVLAIIVGQLWLPTTTASAYRYANEDCVSECNSAEGITRYLWYGYADQQTTVQDTETGSRFFVGSIDDFFVTKGVSPRAENVNAGAALNRKFSALEKAQQNAASVRELPDGRSDITKLNAPLVTLAQQGALHMRRSTIRRMGMFALGMKLTIKLVT